LGGGEKLEKVTTFIAKLPSRGPKQTEQKKTVQEAEGETLMV